MLINNLTLTVSLHVKLGEIAAAAVAVAAAAAAQGWPVAE